MLLCYLLGSAESIRGVASSDHDGPPRTTHGVYAKALAGHKRNKGPTGQSGKDPLTETPDNAGNITAVEESLGGGGAQLEYHNVMGSLYSRLLCLLQVRRDNYPFRDGLRCSREVGNSIVKRSLRTQQGWCNGLSTIKMVIS